MAGADRHPIARGRHHEGAAAEPGLHPDPCPVLPGARLGLRYRGQTLLVEVGWPRTPEQGIVPDLGLARARVSLSPNVMIDPIQLDDLTLRRDKDGTGVSWHVLKDHSIRDLVTEEKLRAYVQRATAE